MTSLINVLSSNRFMMKIMNYFMEISKKRIPYRDDNPFLKGPFAPVKGEIYAQDLKVIGEIPMNLNGVFLRMGPNPIEVKNPTLYNWFVGDGMVHALRIQDGKALWYKNRYVGTHRVHDKLNIPRIKGHPRGPIDVVNTNIIGHAGKIWTIVEAGPLPIEMDADLNSISYSFFNSNERYEFSAHPHKDHDTGELHAICYDALIFNRIFYHVISKNGQLVKRVSIPVQHGPMMHDCSMTKSHMVIFDLPITFSLSNIMKGADFPYSWNDKHKARIGLLPKNGEAHDIQWFAIDPCFVFHSCNSYDLENGDVIVDVAVHEKTFANTIQGPSDEQRIRFERWHLHRESGQLSRKVISEIPQEFPRFDERLAGKPYRYAYTISLGHEGERVNSTNLIENSLLRHDMETGETLKHSYGDGYSTGEVIFVPKGPNSAEDEGWLISYVHSLTLQPTKIFILDAQCIDGKPQAIIELPVHVPFGFHSNWIDYNESSQ